jgi:hypothetical protein
MSLWLRGDRAGQIDEKGCVRVWEIQAPGSLEHAVQHQAASRPQWLETVCSLDGRAALRFDGKDDFLHLPWLRIGRRTTVILVAENADQTATGRCDCDL